MCSRQQTKALISTKVMSQGLTVTCKIVLYNKEPQTRIIRQRVLALIQGQCTLNKKRSKFTDALYIYSQPIKLETGHSTVTCQIVLYNKEQRIISQRVLPLIRGQCTFRGANSSGMKKVTTMRTP